MVSVVITAYNREAFLRECIDSALAQDHSSFEVIVVDDGSTDGTKRICSEYGARVRYFWKPNGGAASAKNFGIRKMRGEWLKILDSDDVLEPNALSAFSEWARKSRSDWLFCNCVQIDSNGRLYRTWQPGSRLAGDELIRALWSMWNPTRRRRLPFSYSALSGMGFIRKPLLLNLGLLDESLTAFEDWEWALRASLIHRRFGSYVPLPLYRYRQHPGQLTAWKWEVEREHAREIARKAVRSRLAEAPPSLIEHYRRDARRLRRTYLPLILLGKSLKSPSLQTRARFWGWTIAPSLMDRIYWSANPPVDTG